MNQISRARLEIAKGLDDDESEVPASGELASVRSKRRELMGSLAAMPTTSGEFDARDVEGRKQWNEVSQSSEQSEPGDRPARRRS